jgi:hypothetical protein
MSACAVNPSTHHTVQRQIYNQQRSASIASFPLPEEPQIAGSEQGVEDPGLARAIRPRHTIRVVQAL